MFKRYLGSAAIIALAALPSFSVAMPLATPGNARLVSVTSKYGTGCVSGPTGGSNDVQKWDVERGDTYTLTLTNVTDCGNGGTAATIHVTVKSSSTIGLGNTDLVAYYVSPGVYRFEFYMPTNGVCTFPITYCAGAGETALFVRRSDGVAKQAHLRAAFFVEGCTNPVPVDDGSCSGTIPVETSSWGAVKAMYE